LGYAFENIDAKLAGLEERGFANPVKLVTTSPAILGLAFKNIDRRMRYLCRLFGAEKCRELLGRYVVLWSTKPEKLMTVARALYIRTGKIDPKPYCTAVTKNLEQLLVMWFWCEKVARPEAKQRIREHPERLPRKVRLHYERGYDVL
jgi:hypothetical protein